MSEYDDLTEARQSVDRLTTYWAQRNMKFTEWYRILLLEDKLKTANMESFVTNDPRTAYNLALHLLTPTTIPHRVPTDPLDLVEIPGSSEVERMLGIFWKKVDLHNRQRARKGWVRELVSFILSVGWYSVFVMVQKNRHGVDECLAEIWNPHDVYPAFDDYNGLVEVVHTYDIDRRSLAKKALEYGYTLANLPAYSNMQYSMINCQDYWYYGNDGGVYNCVLANNQFIKPPTRDDDLEEIPVVVSPAGGLPDRGSILNNDEWKQHVGEAMVATNESVIHNYNKQMSFLQQLLRDVAQPVSVEKSQGGNTIVKNPEELYKRGGHFKLGPQDDLGFLSKPALPVELRSQLFDIHNMVQRGSLPDVMFGNIQQQVTGYLISQVSSTAQQMLDPYAEATQYCLADIPNMWLRLIKKKGARPWKMKVPALPEGVEIEVDLRVHIPGDLTQRANVARMLNPQFKLSQTLLLDLLFPEVQNPLHEISRQRSEDAQNNPIAKQIDLIRAFREHIELLTTVGDHATAREFESAVQMLTDQLHQQARKSGAVGQGQQPGVIQPYNQEQMVAPGALQEVSPNVPQANGNGTGAY